MSKSFYILIAADVHQRLLHLPSAKDVATARIKQGLWGLHSRTKNKNSIQDGDHLIIYLSGIRNPSRVFFASTTVSQKIDLPSPSLKSLVDRDLMGASSVPTSILKLNPAHIFKNPVSIYELKHRLSFIKNPDSPKWGSCMQGGCIRITKNDYNIILKLAGF